MLQKRMSLDENMNMTFGIGVPVDILGDNPPFSLYNRVFPSPFTTTTMPMNCTLIKNVDTPPQQLQN